MDIRKVAPRVFAYKDLCIVIVIMFPQVRIGVHGLLNQWQVIGSVRDVYMDRTINRLAEGQPASGQQAIAAAQFQNGQWMICMTSSFTSLHELTELALRMRRIGILRQGLAGRPESSANARRPIFSKVNGNSVNGDIERKIMRIIRRR